MILDEHNLVILGYICDQLGANSRTHYQSTKTINKIIENNVYLDIDWLCFDNTQLFIDFICCYLFNG